MKTYNYIVKVLLSRSKSHRYSVKELGISPNTVKKIKDKFKGGHTDPYQQIRTKKLSVYHDQIMDLVENNMTAVFTYNTTTNQTELSKLITHRTKMFGADFTTSIKSIIFGGEGAYFLTEDDEGNNSFIKNLFLTRFQQNDEVYLKCTYSF